MSQVHWPHEAIISLLEKVRENEVLWNIRHAHYPKKNLKRQLFSEIKDQLIQNHPRMASLTTGNVWSFCY